MQPQESVRFHCQDCHIAFDITVAPPEEWGEPIDITEIDHMEIGQPTACPFCGASELKTVEGASAAAGRRVHAA